jgi:hypothetical protein
MPIEKSAKKLISPLYQLFLAIISINFTLTRYKCSSVFCKIIILCVLRLILKVPFLVQHCAIPCCTVLFLSISFEKLVLSKMLLSTVINFDKEWIFCLAIYSFLTYRKQTCIDNICHQ